MRRFLGSLLVAVFVASMVLLISTMRYPAATATYFGRINEYLRTTSLRYELVPPSEAVQMLLPVTIIVPALLYLLLASADRRVKQFKARIAELSAERETLQSKARTAESERDTARDRVEELEEKLAVLAEPQLLQLKLEVAEQQLKELRSERDKAVEVAEELQEANLNLARKDADLRVVQAELAAKTTSLANLEAELDEEDEDEGDERDLSVAELHRKVLELTAENGKLNAYESQEDELVGQIAQLRQELADAQQLAAEFKGFKKGAQVRRIRRKLESEQERLATAEGMIVQRQRELDGHSGTLDRRAADLEAAEGRLATHMREFEELRTSVNRMMENVSRLQEDLAQRQAALDDRQANLVEAERVIGLRFANLEHAESTRASNGDAAHPAVASRLG